LLWQAGLLNDDEPHLANRKEWNPRDQQKVKSRDWPLCRQVDDDQAESY